MTQANEQPASSTGARWTSGRDLALIGITWLLFLLALPFLEGETFSLETLTGGGLLGVLVISIGFMAASRVRPALDRRPSVQARFMLLAIRASQMHSQRSG